MDWRVQAISLPMCIIIKTMNTGYNWFTTWGSILFQDIYMRDVWMLPGVWHDVQNFGLQNPESIGGAWNHRSALMCSTKLAAEDPWILLRSGTSVCDLSREISVLYCGMVFIGVCCCIHFSTPIAAVPTAQQISSRRSAKVELFPRLLGCSWHIFHHFCCDWWKLRQSCLLHGF